MTCKNIKIEGRGVLFIARNDIEYEEMKSYEREIEVLNIKFGVNNGNSVNKCNIGVVSAKDSLMYRGAYKFSSST